ncbi:MAG TPA: cyclic nucleotide-binding domain-containing protein [Humidesulfovibrio sp.]|uniref:cyclic nucleotide-binding domain-containing protein n=1 Tax=Humidesulfovibrio sp. TaxID=2910988 RepID=UPI002C386750|nr:cyclic nucleotide-binding domain-containing protein [Humidesulfovibrio sp.]HWR04048.1 cyclic nucleotide-binding domain-containing protein [Humidesulfovibrio sp.]
MPLPGSRDSSVVMKRVSQGSFLQRTVLKHNVIFSEGSKGEEAYILVDGKVEISGSVDGRKKVFAVLQPVSIFGEMALFLENHGRTATAIALEDSKVVVLNGDDLDGYIESAPPAIQAILNVMVTRLKNTTKKALRAPNVPMGIVRVLDLFELNGKTEILYDSAVRHLADIFVCSPATIEGYLQGLVTQGHLAIDVSGAAGPAASGRRVIRLLTPHLMQAVLMAGKTDKVKDED